MVQRAECKTHKVLRFIYIDVICQIRIITPFSCVFLNDGDAKIGNCDKFEWGEYFVLNIDDVTIIKQYRLRSWYYSRFTNINIDVFMNRGLLVLFPLHGECRCLLTVCPRLPI